MWEKRRESEWIMSCQVKVGIPQGSVLSPFLLAVVVHVVTDLPEIVL